MCGLLTYLCGSLIFLEQHYITIYFTVDYKFARTILLFLLFFSFSLVSLAQTNSLLGTVKFKNGKPISDATVLIKNTDKHTLTDDKGNFEFENIKYGEYHIEVVAIGVKREKFHIHFKKDSKPVNLTIEETAHVLNEVTISTQTQKKKIETEGYAVNVIEIENTALQSIQTNELLDRAAGVRIRQDGGLGSHIHYNVNGMTGSAIKIFIDGVPATNFGPSFSLNSIPPALIERIEVYKGVIPGHLSDDALGGAINVVMKQNKKNTLTTSYSYGSFNTHQFNINGGYRTDKGFAVNASAFYNYSDNDYEVWGKEITFRNYDGTVV